MSNGLCKLEENINETILSKRRNSKHHKHTKIKIESSNKTLKIICLKC